MVAGRTRIRNRSWGHLFESCEFEVPQRCGGVEQYLIGQRFGFETRDRLVQGEYAVLESDEDRIHRIVGHWPFHDIEIVEEIRCSVGYDEPQPFGVRFLKSPDLQFLGCFEPVVLIYVEDGRTIVPSFEYLGGPSAGLFPLEGRVESLAEVQRTGGFADFRSISNHVASMIENHRTCLQIFHEDVQHVISTMAFRSGSHQASIHLPLTMRCSRRRPRGDAPSPCGPPWPVRGYVGSGYTSESTSHLEHP